MIGDVDRQQSIRSWLARRKPNAPSVLTWVVDSGKVFRAPRGTTHAVLDTPGAVYDYALTKIVVSVDAVVVPVGPSIFDHDASIACLQDLQKHPRIASGRCKLIAVGMRWPQERIDAWHAAGKQWKTPLLTIIPENVIYRECLEDGASIFEAEAERLDRQMIYWQPLLDWLSAFWTGESARVGKEGNYSGMSVSISHKNQLLEEPSRIGDVPNIASIEEGSRPLQAAADIKEPVPAYLLKDSASGTASTAAPISVTGCELSHPDETRSGVSTQWTPPEELTNVSDTPLSSAATTRHRSWISRLLQIK
jgi:hypothetical protein